MINVNIFNSDGSVYWREYFNDQRSAAAWLDEEKTRPYWKKDFVVVIEDKSKEIEVAEAQAKKALEDKRALIKSFLDKPIKSSKDLEDVLVSIADLLGIK